MQPEELENLAAIRVVVGFLGEKEQAGWWPSSFFARGSSAFLSPLFPRTQFLAQCHGVTTAASRMHDERIGVGQVYHLFRLPEDIEQRIHRLLHDADVMGRLKQHVADRGTAMRVLEAGKEATRGDVGPTLIAATVGLRDASAWRRAAAKYAQGFECGTRIFPYFADRK